MLKKIIGNDSKQNIVWWSVVAFALWGFLLATYFFLPDLYLWLATEDAMGENLTAVFYGISGILLMILPFKSTLRGRRRFKGYFLSSLLALFFIFVAGEEVSWGQRYLGIKTPESMAEDNVQNEFNIHNLKIFDKESSLINQHTFLNLFALGFGVLIPLFNRWVPPGRKLLEMMYFPVIPMSFCMFFVVGLAHGQTIAKWQTHWTHTEVKELILSVGILLFGISYFLNHPFKKSKLKDS